MRRLKEPGDQQLLADQERPADAFATFYRRHLPTVLAYVLRRVRDPELAADLTAEVFAAALAARASFDASRGTAPAWLCTIAAHKIADSFRRGRVEDECRRRLGMDPIELDDLDLRRVEEMATARSSISSVERALAGLPAGTRAAIERRVLQEQPYAQIASRLEVSESVVRKRVSRGLDHLRTQAMDIT